MKNKSKISILSLICLVAPLFILPTFCQVKNIQPLPNKDRQIFKETFTIDNTNFKSKIVTFDGKDLFFDDSVSVLHGALFEKGIRVNNTIFQSALGFGSGESYGEIFFRKTSFKEFIDFRRFKFQKNALHISCKFNKGLWDKSIFFGGAIFEKCSFEEDASFHNVVFENKAYFADSKFRIVGFRESKFKNECNFTAATFNEIANFSDCEFEKSIIFSAAKFKGNTYFEGTVFPDTIHFEDIETEKNIDFSKVAFNRKDKYTIF